MNPAPLLSTRITFSVTGLTAGTQYYFTVRAINVVGASVPREASARPTS